MQSMVMLRTSALVLLTTGLVVCAQEKAEDLTSGFRAFIVAEPRFEATDIRSRVGKMQDLITDRGLDPTIAIFSRTIPKSGDDPLIGLVKKCDELSVKHKLKRLTSFVVFLSLKDEFRKDESRDALLTQIGAFVKAAQPAKTTVGLSEATIVPSEGAAAAVPAQVSAYGITADDDLTILVIHNFQVVKRWKFKAGMPPGEAELAELAKTAEQVAGKR